MEWERNLNRERKNDGLIFSFYLFIIHYKSVKNFTIQTVLSKIIGRMGEKKLYHEQQSFC